MPESTQAIARLPGLDVELVHDRTDDGNAERIAVRLTGRPDLKTAAKVVEPQLWTMLFSANPFYAMQADLLRRVWGPFLDVNPFLKGVLPPSRDGD